MNLQDELNDENCEVMRLLRFPWWTMLLGGALLAAVLWFGARMCRRGPEIEIIATEE